MVNQRSVAMAIILTVLTCGVYGLYWFVCITDDLNTLTGENDTSGALALVLTIVTCGIYGIYWCYKTGDKVDNLKFKRGFNSTGTSILYLILSIFGFQIIVYALAQDEINRSIENIQQK